MADQALTSPFTDSALRTPRVFMQLSGNVSNNDDLNSAPKLAGRTIVTWGDSTANFVGVNLRAIFKNTVNLGRNGAGIDNVLPPNPIGTLPPNAIVLMSIGGNDVEGMIGRSQQYIDSYAKRVIGLAQAVQAQGATPILIGHSIPPAPYIGPVPGGGPSHWNDPGFYESWVATVAKVNAAINEAATAAGITWSETESRIPKSERARDNLHYNTRGSRHVAVNALRDAGFL